MKHIGLFEGIGGFSLAARWAGWETIAWCEWNDFGQKILKYHFPNAQGHGDITKTDFTIYRGQCDIVTGGFPCQPYSLAGNRKGKDDERHLWPEMLRAIKEIQPSWVVGENVYGLVNWSGGLVFHEVQSDLEAQGYEVFPYVLPAAGVQNCPHRRDRVWFVAYSKTNRQSSSKKTNGWKEHKQNDWTAIRHSSDTNGNCRTTPHPNLSGNTTPGSGTDENGQTQIEEWEYSQSQFSGLCNKRTTPHPNRNELNGSDCQHEVNASEGGVNAFGDIEQSNDNGNVADTCHTGLERSKVGRSIGGSRSESHEFTSRHICSTWQNFPTQSPVRTGDDGISSRLDGITFSKWRNQSIMAAGNAIVPQVAYQIFKTINQYLKCNQTT